LKLPLNSQGISQKLNYWSHLVSDGFKEMKN